MKGFGTTFHREDDQVTPAMQQIAGVHNFGEMGKSRGTYDTTAQDQADPYKTFGGGLVDAGEFELELTFKDAAADANYDLLLSDIELDAPRRYEVRLPTTGKTKFTFDALVTDIGVAMPMEDKIVRKVKFKLSGKPVTGVWT